MNITWTFSGSPVTSQPGVRVIPTGARSSFLSVESVGAAHSGLYTCTATNAVGSTSHTARITVKGQWRLRLLTMSFHVLIQSHSYSIPKTNTSYPRLFFCMKLWDFSNRCSISASGA